MPSGKNLLLLEDNPTALAVLQSSLKNALPDIVLFSATSIEAAQRIAAANRIDLFILDIHLPDGTGLEFLTDMKMVHPDAHAVVVTATPLPAYRQYASRAGAVSFLEKPVHPQRFRQFVIGLLNPASVQTETSSGKKEGYAGMLRDLSIVDVVQIKCLGGQTTAVEFESPAGEKGMIYFAVSKITHAETIGLRGIPAFEQIVSWKGGSFHEFPGRTCAAATIQGDWQMLLMEAVRKSDETQLPN